MNNIIYKFNNDIYPVILKVTFSKESFKKIAKDESNEFSGACVSIGSHVLIYIKKVGEGMDVTHAAHEAYHAADKIREIIGMEYQDSGTNEHMAYLIQWVMHKMFDALDLSNEMDANSLM